MKKISNKIYFYFYDFLFRFSKPKKMNHNKQNTNKEQILSAMLINIASKIYNLNI